MKKVFAVLLSVGIITLLGGCSLGKKERMVNEEKIGLTGVNTIKINYGEGHLEFFASNSNDIVIKEFMSIHKNSYDAVCNVSGNTLAIESGQRPTDPTFVARMEVYLPSQYSHDLSVTTGGGRITMETRHGLDNLLLQSTSGGITCSNIVANQIQIVNDSGSIDGKDVSGVFDLNSGSGSTRLYELDGSGNFVGGSGRMELSFSELQNDLSVTTHSGRLELKIPKNIGCDFQAHTSSGSLQVSLDGDLTTEEKQVVGTIGQNPLFSISLSSTSGRVQVSHT